MSALGDLSAAVLDASVAIKLVVNEVGSTEAARLLDGRPLYAPSLMLVEAANALWAMARRGVISGADAADALTELARLPLTPVPYGFEPTPRALSLALLLDHPVYDCIYLSLAIEIGVPVVTADTRFVKAAERHADTRLLVCPLQSES